MLWLDGAVPSIKRRRPLWSTPAGAPRVQGRSPAGAPDRTRTCGLRIRNPLLYPAELRAPVG